MPACRSLLVMVCQKERNVAPIPEAMVNGGCRAWAGGEIERVCVCAGFGTAVEGRD
jgi:hypothetical protein